MHHYVEYEKDIAFAVMSFPVGVVALDIDEPLEEAPGRAVMLKEVRELATSLSRAHGLGLFWMYYTASGIHIIFQSRVGSESAALEVLLDANDPANYPRWRECGGHMAYCAGGAVELRVGYKPARPIWDIFPVAGNPPVSCAPDHVQEHHALLALRLPVKKGSVV